MYAPFLSLYLMPSRDNFNHIASGIPTEELAEYLFQNPYLWNLNKIRQSFTGSPHVDTKCIFVRGPKEFTVEEYMGTLDAVVYDIPTELVVKLNAVLRSAEQYINVREIGYILIVNLTAGGAVQEHRDEGTYAEYYDRYHLVVKSSEGNIFTVNGEDQEMRTGELWKFNHRALHSVVNNSTEDRIHIIFDVK